MEAVFRNEGNWRSRFVHMHERVLAQERCNKKK